MCGLFKNEVKATRIIDAGSWKFGIQFEIENFITENSGETELCQIDESKPCCSVSLRISIEIDANFCYLFLMLKSMPRFMNKIIQGF